MRGARRHPFAVPSVPRVVLQNKELAVRGKELGAEALLLALRCRKWQQHCDSPCIIFALQCKYIYQNDHHESSSS